MCQEGAELRLLVREDTLQLSGVEYIPEIK